MPDGAAKQATRVVENEGEGAAMTCLAGLTGIAQVVAQEDLACQPDGKWQDRKREQQREPERNQFALQPW